MLELAIDNYSIVYDNYIYIDISYNVMLCCNFYKRVSHSLETKREK